MKIVRWLLSEFDWRNPDNEFSAGGTWGLVVWVVFVIYMLVSGGFQ